MTEERVGRPDVPTRADYENPPIVEGLCQFNFSAPLAWGPILPGAVYERLVEEYEAEPQVQQQVHANVQFPNDAAGEAALRVGQGDQRIIFRNADHNRLFVLSPSTVSANSLPRYEGWPALLERFARSLEQTRDVLRNPLVASVVVRYINRVFVPMPEPVELGEYFLVPYRQLGGGEATTRALFQRVEATFGDEVTSATLTFASVDPQEGETDGQAFLLDLEFRRMLPEPTGYEAALEVGNQLKTLENEEFEASITDRTRELFA